MKQKQLNINLTQSKPDRTYKIDINYDYQVKELCSFIRNNKDKKVSIIINDKHTKFDSLAGKKRFSAGFEQGSKFVADYMKKLISGLKREAASLKREAETAKKDMLVYKDKYANVIGKLQTNNLLKQLRTDTYLDSVQELNDDRAMLKARLDLVEPVIKLVGKARTDGELQKAYKLAKKNGLVNDG